MITAYYNSTLAAFVYANRKRHLLSVAAFAAYLARVSWVYSFKRPASVLSFAFRHCEKASPGHVADCSGETAILDHPADVRKPSADWFDILFDVSSLLTESSQLTHPAVFDNKIARFSYPRSADVSDSSLRFQQGCVKKSLLREKSRISSGEIPTYVSSDSPP